MGIKIAPISDEKHIDYWEQELLIETILNNLPLSTTRIIEENFKEKRDQVLLSKSVTKITYYHDGEEGEVLYEEQNNPERTNNPRQHLPWY